MRKKSDIFTTLDPPTPIRRNVDQNIPRVNQCSFFPRKRFSSPPMDHSQSLRAPLFHDSARTPLTVLLFGAGWRNFWDFLSASKIRIFFAELPSTIRTPYVIFKIVFHPGYIPPSKLPRNPKSKNHHPLCHICTNCGLAPPYHSPPCVF